MSSTANRGLFQIGVLALPGSWYFRDLQRAATDHPTVARLRSLTFSKVAAALGDTFRVGTCEHADFSDLDAVLVRTMPAGTLEQIVFRMNALHRLAASGTTVVLNSPRTLEVAVDKYLALAQLEAAGLKVPATRTSQDWQQAMADFAALGGDVVVKPLFGSEGRGILRVSDESSAWRVFKTLTQLGHVIYQQVFIPHPGYDIRVLKVGDSLHGMRRSNAHDFRTNVSQGATTSPWPVDDLLRSLAERAAAAVEATFVGIDFLPGLDGELYVLEVNAVPGWRALAKTLDIDIGAEVLRLLVE